MARAAEAAGAAVGVVEVVHFLDHRSGLTGATTIWAMRIFGSTTNGAGP